MPWVNQYTIGDEVIITRLDSDMYGQQGVVSIVDRVSIGILVYITRSDGSRVPRAYFKETDIRPCGVLGKRPVSPVFYSLKETY